MIADVRRTLLYRLRYSAPLLRFLRVNERSK